MAKTILVAASLSFLAAVMMSRAASPDAGAMPHAFADRAAAMGTR